MDGDHAWCYQPAPWCRTIVYLTAYGETLEVGRYWRPTKADEHMWRLTRRIWQTQDLRSKQ